MLTLNRRKNEPPYAWLDEDETFYSPNSIQIASSVRGHDPRYRIRPKQVPRWLSIVLHALAGLFVISLFLIGYAIVFYVVSGE